MDRVIILRREATQTPAERGLPDSFPMRVKASQPRGASTPLVQGATPGNSFHSPQQEPETTAASSTADATMADEGSSSKKHKRSKKKKKEGKKSKSKEHHGQDHETKKKRRKKRHEDSAKTDAREHECALDSEKTEEIAGTAEAPPPPAKRSRLMSALLSPPTARAEEPARRAPQSDPDKRPLQKLLGHLLNDLQKMDQREFFAWPASDVIWPGYSARVRSPMDFSTMKKKIEDNSYTCVSEFREDLKLMCDNAMTYHESDTVYFNSAKQMWNYVNKLLSKDQLLALKSSLPFFEELTSEELGFVFKAANAKPVDAKPPPATAKRPRRAKASPTGSPARKLRQRCQERTAKLKSPNETQIKAQKAGHVARRRLTAKRANSKFGFLRQTEDGSTSLSILTPHPEGRGGSTANLEMLVGKLECGTATLINAKDRVQETARPVAYLEHGPYSTYAPHYDSTFANLSKEESDLVYSTCGDELSVQHAETLPSFANDCDNITGMVRCLLDKPTSGRQLSKTVEALNVRCEDKNLGPSSNPDAKHDSKPSGSSAFNGRATDIAVAGSKRATQREARKDFTERRCVREDHKHNAAVPTSAMIQQKLQESGEMIGSLSRMQQERLGRAPPAHLSQIWGPSEQELELAEKVTKALCELVSFATPGSVVSVEAIRKAMGINYSPSV